MVIPRNWCSVDAWRPLLACLAGRVLLRVTRPGVSLSKVTLVLADLCVKQNTRIAVRLAIGATHGVIQRYTNPGTVKTRRTTMVT